MEALFSEKLDNNLRMDLVQMFANRWLSVRLEAQGNFLVLLAGLSVVFGSEQLTASSAGMQLSYALMVTSLLNMVIRVYTMAENAFNSVERIKVNPPTHPPAHLSSQLSFHPLTLPLFVPCSMPQEYSETAPEAATHQDPPPPKGWPRAGAVSFKAVKARYREDLPLVLLFKIHNIQSWNSMRCPFRS